MIDLGPELVVRRRGNHGDGIVIRAFIEKKGIRDAQLSLTIEQTDIPAE